jgi:O-methyltransferase domain/Dimerisation domain
MTNESSSNLPLALQVSKMIVSFWVPQAIYVAAELGIADVLSEQPLNGRSVAARLASDPDATERLLRALVSVGLLTRHEHGFALTDLGRCLETRAPASRRAWSRLTGGPQGWASWGRLIDCVRTGKKAYGSSGNDEMDTFDALAADPDAVAIFHQAMADATRGVAPALADAIDFMPARRVVDVGGGYGALLCAVLEKYPHLEGAVFDLPPAREGALALFAECGVAARAGYVAGSFFETPPPSADVYLLKSVIHDWDDVRSVGILSRCREAMSDNARLVLVEPAAGAPAGSAIGDWFVAFSDLNMLVATGGRERSEREYVALLEAADLKVTDVRRTQTFYTVFESVRT